MTKIQNSKQNFKIKVLNFEHLNFEFARPPKFCPPAVNFFEIWASKQNFGG